MYIKSYDELEDY